MDIKNATEIKVALLRLGITQAQIARDLKVSRATVSQVIHRTCKSRRIADYINKLLGEEAI